MAESGRNLAKLNNLDDYTVASGDPDPRGWDVQTIEGRRIGRVADLLVDMNTMKARYLDVALDREVAGTDREARVLIPTSAARIGEREREEERVTISMTPEHVARAAGKPEGVTEPEVSERDWPSAGVNACEVRVRRGGL